MIGVVKILANFKKILGEEFRNSLSSLDDEKLQAARDLILAAEAQGGRVHITGIGKPSYVAGYIASLLSSTGTPAYFLDATEAVHGSSGQVRTGDVVIAISNSGETAELLYTVETVKRNGARLISVSQKLSSALAKLSDIALCAGAKQEGDGLNKPPRASILSEIITLQALSILLQEAKGLDTQMYVQWHPGGALGDSARQELKG